jgi:rubrerythrin
MDVTQYMEQNGKDFIPYHVRDTSYLKEGCCRSDSYRPSKVKDTTTCPKCGTSYEKRTSPDECPWCGE